MFKGQDVLGLGCFRVRDFKSYDLLGLGIRPLTLT